MSETLETVLRASVRTLAAAAGLSPSRVHQLVADADLDALDAALGELRAAGWPAPEDPDSGEDTELGGRDICPPAVNLRPPADWPDRAIVAVDLARVAAVIDRIAANVDELARARPARVRGVLAGRFSPPRIGCGWRLWHARLQKASQVQASPSQAV